jgi:hypothetical protein
MMAKASAVAFCCLLCHLDSFGSAAVITANARIDTTAVIATTSANFLGVNIDAASLWQGTKPHRLNFSDAGLRKLGALFAKSSQGSLLRIGGSSAEDLGFGLDTNQTIACEPAYMDTIFDFVQKSEFKLVWDLNSMKMRDANNAWDSKNAEEFLRYVAAKPAFAKSLYALQLGNEPGHYMVSTPGAPTPTQHGKDFLILQKVVNKVFGQHKPLLQGPDVCFGLGHWGPTGADKCANLSYFSDFIRATAPTGPESCILDQVDTRVSSHESQVPSLVTSLFTSFTPFLVQVSAHHYGLAGPKNGDPGQCIEDDFLTPTIWETKVRDILQGWKQVQEKECPSAKMVLSETATTGDGGCNRLNGAPGAVTSNSFIAGFYWISQLSIAASLGYYNVYRQDLVGYSGMGRFGDDGHLISGGSSYALAGEPGWVGGPYNASFVDANRTAALLPNPDFFTSVLWKRLVGDKVLAVVTTPDVSSSFVDSDHPLRVFATCAAPFSTGGGSGLTVVFNNFGNTTVKLDLQTGVPSDVWAAVRSEYHLTTGAADGVDLNARTMRLNGEILTATSSLAGKKVASSDDLVLKPRSYGFVLLQTTTASGLPLCSGSM